MESKQVTSIRIDSGLWKEAKKYAIDQGITMGKLIEGLLEREIGRKNKERKGE